MNGVIESLGVNTTFSRERGTPQKRLHDLLEACQTIVKTNNRSIFKGKITTLDVQGLIDDLETASREDMFKSIADRNLFCEYIDLFISSLKSTPDQITKNKISITVWLLVLVKSMSDISQCGSLVNDIPKFYEGGNISTIGKSTGDTTNDVLSVLKSNKNVTFVSSDKICAALSSNILKLIDYPIQTLCSRKTGTTTQTMIVQKGEVSALSVILSVVGDLEKTMGLINDVIYYDSSDIDRDAVANMVTSIHSVVTDYYSKIFDEYFKDPNIKDYVTQDIIQLEVDNIFISKNDRGREKLCQLISEISSIPILRNSLLELSRVLSLKENVIVPRWTYHVSNDVFKYMFPLTPDMFIDLKSKISREEIVSATADAMYGHDFALSCITDLGREFLTAIGEANVYTIDENVSYSKKEDLCISQTLQLNNFSTINQHGDKFSINFNSDSNYLVVDRKEMFYRISETPWNITSSPLVNQPIIASVDFVSGEPSISVVLSEQINEIKQQSIRREQVLAFSTLSQEDLTDKLKVIEENTNYNEYYGVTTLYDGAAPYGGLPIYQLDQYKSSMNVVLKPSKKQKDELEENVTLTVITKTTESEEELKTKWISGRVDTFDISYLKDNLIPNVGLSEEQKGQLSNPQDTSSPLYKFNLIWGTILNSKSKLTLKFREEIYNEFRLVVAEIQNKIRQLNEKVAERSRRASIQQPISRFPRYEIFTNEIMELVEQLQQFLKLNESLEKFDVMMIEYIKILFSDEIDDSNKNILLKILESAVRVCSDDPDGVFKSLLSYKESIQQVNENEELKKIGSVAEEKIKRDRNIANIKKNYLQQISRKQGSSKNKIQLSGETTYVTPEKDRYGKQIQPGSDKSVKSAFAALYPSTSHWNREKDSQMSGLTETQGDNILFNSPIKNDDLSPQGSQETDYSGFESDTGSEIGRPKKSDSPPLSPRGNTRSFDDVDRSTESITYGQHPRTVPRISGSQDNSDDENMTREDNEGGSRKHHRTHHNSVTRRKNKKSSKRKSGKKRKMLKRNNKTRRN
jgi:hypothetical protein